MIASRILSASALLVLLSTLGLGKDPAHHTSSPRKRIALSELSDGLGWKQRTYYSTIQTADIDRDGQDEVIARWIDGLHIWRFQNGTLVRAARPNTMLSDNAGFYEPSWYATMQTAVLDPRYDRADVIARESDGIHVFRYDSAKQEWYELGGSVSSRPFADHGTDDTDWTQPSHYLTIQLADLNKDGAAELVGRGRNGIQVYAWNPASESWVQLSAGGHLGDGEGFDQERYYSSIQLVDVDHDGAAELIARGPSGVQTYKWGGADWTPLGSSGPFGDSEDLLSGAFYKSLGASVDITGQAWLYGIVPGPAGVSTGVIRIYRWQNSDWQPVSNIHLPGLGWERASQLATLMAADIQGDPTPEFVVRGARGLCAYTLDGRALPKLSQSFTDAQGWNLAEEYGTLHTVRAQLNTQDGSYARTLIVGRGRDGLEAYQFAGRWTEAADSSFPQYCTNFNDDSSPQCLAYKAISNRAIVGQMDIRSQYTQASYHKGDWTSFQGSVNVMSNPNGPNTDPEWQSVHTEMVQELGYVATTRGWFDNNLAVLTDNYNRSADLLGEAQSDVALASSDSVVARWASFALDIVAGISRFTPAGPGVSLMDTIFNDVYTKLANHNGDLNETVDAIYDDLNTQRNNYTTANASEQTEYLTDYSKLTQIGQDSVTGGFDWSDATLNDIANAENGAALGMLMNFYKSLIPNKWQVLWCTGPSYGSCDPVDTPQKYNCSYGTPSDPSQPYQTNAYIATGWPPWSSPLNWSLADKLTGSEANGGIDAIWYMMLLGGDAGWDLFAQYCEAEFCRFKYNGHDPNIDYDNIKYGYNGPSSSCAGNGSFNGIITGSQSLSQRLGIAQQNTRHVTASEAADVLRQIRRLEEEVRNSFLGNDVEVELLSSLKTATHLVKRATLRLPSGQEGTTSATTPTHLLEWFVRRVELHRDEIGKEVAASLMAHAYDVVAQLEGQGQTAALWCRHR